MKIRLLTLAVFVSALFTACSQNGKVSIKKNQLNSEIDSVSYVLGADIGNKLKGLGLDDINYDAFLEGVNTTIKGDTSKINMQKGMGMLNGFFQKKHVEKIAKNKKEGEEFLAANKTKKGVKVTDSGIQYIILKEGKGKHPNDSSMVKVHYHGTLINGKVFDSSVDRGEPIEFPVNGVIKGWQEILPMMSVGSKWKVFIPTELAYGANPRRGGIIEPNMALVFEIELLDIVKPKDKTKNKK